MPFFVEFLQIYPLAQRFRQFINRILSLKLFLSIDAFMNVQLERNIRCLFNAV